MCGFSHLLDGDADGTQVMLKEVRVRGRGEVRYGDWLVAII